MQPRSLHCPRRSKAAIRLQACIKPRAARRPIYVDTRAKFLFARSTSATLRRRLMACLCPAVVLTVRAIKSCNYHGGGPPMGLWSKYRQPVPSGTHDHLHRYPLHQVVEGTLANVNLWVRWLVRALVSGTLDCGYVSGTLDCGYDCN